MPSKVIRLDEEAIAIALRHGRTVSEGIRSMDAKLTADAKTSGTEDRAGVIQYTLELSVQVYIQDNMDKISYRHSGRINALRMDGGVQSCRPYPVGTTLYPLNMIPLYYSAKNYFLNGKNY